MEFTLQSFEMWKTFGPNYYRKTHEPAVTQLTIALTISSLYKPDLHLLHDVVHGLRI